MKHVSIFLILLVIISLNAISCDDDEASDLALIWQGYWMNWRNEPTLAHRVSLLEFASSTDVINSGSNLTTTIENGLIGGTYSTGESFVDTPYLAQNFLVVNGGKIKAAYGLSHEFVNDQADPETETAISHSLSELGISGCANYSVFLSGLYINTDKEQDAAGYPDEYEPSYGYTLFSYGIQIQDVAVSGDDISFILNHHLEWGPTGETIEDREYMDEAIPLAKTDCAVYYTIIGFNGEIATGTKEYSLEYSAGAFVDQPHATDDEQQVSLSIPGEYNAAFPVITGFQFDNVPKDTLDPKGHYIFAIGVNFYEQVYDAAADTLNFRFDGYLSNMGLVVNRLAYDFTGWYDVIQLSGGASMTTSEKGFSYDDVGSFSENITLP